MSRFRRFSCDVDHPGYGPATPAHPPVAAWAEQPNKTDQGHTQAEQPRSRPEPAVGPNVWRPAHNADLPQGTPGPARGASPGLPGTGAPAPGSRAEDIESFRPSNSNPDGRGIGQPSIQRFPEVLPKRYDPEGVKFWFNTIQINDGTGDFETIKHDVRTGAADRQDRHYSEGYRYRFSGNLDANGQYAVTQSPATPNDLGKISNWSQDRRIDPAVGRPAARAARELCDRMFTNTLVTMNQQHAVWPVGAK